VALTGLPKKTLWGLLVQDFYRPDAFHVTHPTVSKHWSNNWKIETELFKICLLIYVVYFLFYSTLDFLVWISPCQWCSPRDQGLGLEVPRGQKWVLQFFKTFCCNSWRQWARHTMAFCERQQKQFAIRNPLFERTFCTPCTSASVERVFNNGGYLLGHTDASKAQCIDCGKLLSLGSNKPGIQTVHGLKCHLEKCHKDATYTVHEESGIPSTRTTCKKGETGRGIGGTL